MRRKAKNSLPSLSTQTFSPCTESEFQSHTPTFPVPPNLQSPTKTRLIGSYRTGGGIRSFDTCDTIKSSPKRNLRHVRSAITTNDISKPTLIEKKKDFTEDLFHAAQQIRPISAPQSPRIFNFNTHLLSKEDGKRNQEPLSTRTKLHHRGRTDPPVSSATIRARNVLDLKRWSTLFSPKGVTGVPTNLASFQTTQTQFKKFGRTNSPKSEEAWLAHLPEKFHEISHPFSVSAAPGSALGKAITSSGNFLSMSPRASMTGTLNDPLGHETEHILFNLDPHARTSDLHLTHSPTNDMAYSNPSRDRQGKRLSGFHDHPYQRNTFGPRSSGRYTVFHEPIEDVLEEYLMQDEEYDQAARQEQEVMMHTAFSDTNSLYYTPGETSMISESQTFATCLTSVESRMMSERSASSHALSQDGNRSAASSRLLENSSSRANLSDAFSLSTSYRMRHSGSQAFASIKSNDTTIEDWGSRPEGLCVETGDELSTKLKAMLTDQSEQNRQSRLRAWREHARSGSHREAALQALLAQQKQNHRSSFDADFQPDYHRVNVFDFLQTKEHAPAKSDLQRYLQASGAKYEQKYNIISDANEDDCGNAYLDSTMDATSVLENDSESVEIRTAWREKVDQYERLGNGHILRTTKSDDSFDQPQSEGKLIPSDSSCSPVLRPSNIPRRKHPKKPSLLQLSEAEEIQIHDGEIPRPRWMNSQKAAICTIEAQNATLKSLPQSISETTLPDQAIGFDLCAHLLQRARESRNAISNSL